MTCMAWFLWRSVFNLILSKKDVAYICTVIDWTIQMIKRLLSITLITAAFIPLVGGAGDIQGLPDMID